jgi:hypothetical protein
MYRAGGGSAVYSGSLLDRCARDIQVIGQHVGLGPVGYEVAGRVFLGLDAAPPVS